MADARFMVDHHIALALYLPAAMMRVMIRIIRCLALLAALAILTACSPKEQVTPTTGDAELDRLAAIAARVEIIRDDYGVPHVYGETDADAVFGLLYAQAEDDFPRIERNYIWATGRLAEVDGEAAIYSLSLIHI